MRTLVAALLLAAAGLRAEAEPPLEHSLYIRGAAGYRMIQGASMQALFQDLGGGENDGFRPMEEFAFSGGYQSAWGPGLEFSLASGGSNEFKGNGGAWTLSAAKYQGHLLWRWAHANGLFGQPWLVSAGGGLGEGWLSGNFSSPRAYQSLYARANIYSLSLRAEQMLGRHLSLGLELAYHFEKYQPTASSSYRSGGYYGYNYGTLKNADGSDASIDFSGPSIRVSLAFWPKVPIKNRNDALAPGRPRIRGWNPGVDEMLAAGDEAMGRDDFKTALIRFAQAANRSPGNKRAWTGLGNAWHYSKKPHEALISYREALALDPQDAQLKAFITKLEAEP